MVLFVLLLIEIVYLHEYLKNNSLKIPDLLFIKFFTIGNRVPYFITVKNRNTIETWSKNTVEFENSIKDFDFTYSAAQAFGNNQIRLGTKYCLYNGDVNQEGSIVVNS